MKRRSADSVFLLLLVLESINLSEHLPEHIYTVFFKNITNTEHSLVWKTWKISKSVNLQKNFLTSYLLLWIFSTNVLLLLHRIHHPKHSTMPWQFCLQRSEGEFRPLTLLNQKYPASSRDLSRDLYLLQVLMYSWKVCSSLCYFSLQVSSARLSAAASSSSVSLVWPLSPRQHLLHLPVEHSRKQTRKRQRTGQEEGETESFRNVSIHGSGYTCWRIFQSWWEGTDDLALHMQPEPSCVIWDLGRRPSPWELQPHDRIELRIW